MQTIFYKIFGKIADVFGIFDFSFFISGSVAFIQIYLFMLFNDNEDFLVLKEDLNWWKILIVIYILGLVMFALGRFIRQDVFKQKYIKYSLFEKYGILDKSQKKEIDILFCQYWINLRNSKDIKGYEHYSRLWVMTAVYEGLASNVLLAWSLLIIQKKSNTCCICDTCCKNTFLVLGALALGCLIIYILFREARKNADTIVMDFITMNMDCE